MTGKQLENPCPPGEITRRGILAAVLASGTAGCGAIFGGDGGNGEGDGDGESDDGPDDGTATPTLTTVEGPATFDRLRVEGPDETRVDREVAFTVSAANVGSEPGDLAGQLTTVEGAQSMDREVSLPAVESAERASTEVTVTFELADEYLLRVSGEDAEATHETVATGLTAGVGERLELGDGLDVTLTDVSHEVGVFYGDGTDGDRSATYYAPASGQVLSVVRFAVENTATDGRTFGSNLTTTAGSFLGAFPEGALGRTESVDGSPFTEGGSRGAPVQAGQRVEGWLLAQVPRTAASDGFAVNWQRDAPETPPERQWQVDGSALPSFVLAEWTLPDESAPGETDYAVTVRNEGDADGVFRGTVDWSGSESGGWQVRHRLSQRVPAGGSHTFDLSDDWRFVQDRDFRLRPFDEARTVDFFAPTLALEEGLATPFGSITVTAATTGDELVASSTRRDNRSTYTPERGQFVFVEVEYGRQRELRIPNLGRLRSPNGFLLVAGDSEYSHGGIPDRDYHRPVSGVALNTHRGEQVPLGEARRGWLVFDVSADVSLGDATVTWRHSRDDRTSRATWELA